MNYKVMMMLPQNEDSIDDYKFFKTLNEDIKLKQDENNQWDIVFEDYDRGHDLVNVTGKESLINGICIAIMTRYQELYHNPLYEDFGCRIHELIKKNKSQMVKYKIELFCEDTLKRIRRIKKVNEIVVTDNPNNQFYAYKVFFTITCHDDSTLSGSVNL